MHIEIGDGEMTDFSANPCVDRKEMYPEEIFNEMDVVTGYCYGREGIFFCNFL